MLTPTQAFAYFRKSGHLFIAQHDDRWWVTDSYLLFAIEPKGTIPKLLQDYNLPLEPMVCDVHRTIVRREGAKVPDVGNLLPPKFTKKNRDASELTQWRIDNKAVLLEQPGRCSPGEVWRTDAGLHVCLDTDKRRVVDRFVSGTWHAGESDAKPALKLDKDGNALGLLMPLRTLFTQEQVAA